MGTQSKLVTPVGITNPYALLDVCADDSDEVIRVAYRSKARNAHPDRPGGSDEAFNRVMRAYEQIYSAEARAAWKGLAELMGLPVCGHCAGGGSVRRQRGWNAVVVYPCPRCAGAGYLLPATTGT